MPDREGTIGLCATCRYRRLIDNRRGSVFYLCERSNADPLYARYPKLPVLRCAGFELDNGQLGGPSSSGSDG